MLAEHIGSKARSRPRWSPDDVRLIRYVPSSRCQTAACEPYGRERIAHSLRTCPASAAAAPGGDRRDRTDDLMLAKHALSQLSYGPIWALPEGTRQRDGWWAWDDSNVRPHPYQGCALTT